SLHSLLTVATDVAVGVDDVLSLRSNGFLVRFTQRGTAREGGGAFETTVLVLHVFGPDGLATRQENFPPDGEAVALARFDELTGAAPSRGLTVAPTRAAQRRVLANAATRNASALETAFAARDAGAVSALLADGAASVHHPTGVTYDREGMLATARMSFRARDATMQQEPLATLGDFLALFRRSFSASGAAGRKFDVGAYEIEELVLGEVDAQGRCRRAEFFAADSLREAVARLYERYADLLPDGPARGRAAATARSVAALAQSGLDLDRWAVALAPGVESVDHRILSSWSAHGAQAVVQHLRALRDLTDDLHIRDDDIVALRHDAFLSRRNVFGTDRASGGTFERPQLGLWVFGVDGLATRWEQFDVDREAEALARFDELTGEPAPVRFAAAPFRVAEKPARRVRATAATTYPARLADGTAPRTREPSEAL